MKAKLLHKAGSILEGATVEIVAKSGENHRRGVDDFGGASTTSEPVYAVTDDDGHAAQVDTRDLKIVL